jgi:hypothetical protein
VSGALFVRNDDGVTLWEDVPGRAIDGEPARHASLGPLLA